MTYAQQIEATAKRLADQNGRDWSDMGEYERESYRDTARTPARNDIEALRDENYRMRAALQYVIANSGKDTAYSWGLINLRRCRTVALDTLQMTDPKE